MVKVFQNLLIQGSNDVKSKILILKPDWFDVNDMDASG